MCVKMSLLSALMQMSDESFHYVTILLECQLYIHRSDLPEGEDRFNRAVVMILQAEKMRGLGLLKKAIEDAINI
jgi:hypothetical protein